MKGTILRLIVVIVAVAITFFIVRNGVSFEKKQDQAANPDEQTTVDTTTTEVAIPTLTYQKTTALSVGTHRPEIAAYGDQLYLVVVEPDGIIKHKGYIFDATDPANIDFANPEKKFTATTITDEYGEPADHRIAIVNNELWIVYQNLIVPEENRKIGGAGGPMESLATSQSLILARFSLDGEPIGQFHIVTTTDFEKDNLPDLSILPYNDHLLVSTESNDFMQIREIDENGTIVNTYGYERQPEGGLSGMGNSMVMGADDTLLFFASFMSAQSADRKLAVSVINTAFEIEKTIRMILNDNEETFPTGNATYKDFYFISYILRDATEEMSMEKNPYYPGLRIIDQDLNTIWDDRKISEEAGFSHVHPTMTIIEDRLFYAWSKKSGQNAPQVTIEEYVLE